MKSRAPVFLVFLLLAVLAAPAFAAGPYVGAEGGVTFLEKAKVTQDGFPDFDLKTDTGFGLGLVGGFDFGTYRLEGEFAYRRNNNKEVSLGGLTGGIGGDYSSMALMVNGYYDFKMVSPVLYPYLGVGIGGARDSLKVEDGGTVIDDDQFVFAYQAAAGVAFNVTKELTLDLGYKYFATTKPEFEDADGAKAKVEYMSHNIFLGVRYSF